jgi:hypothetical protein
VAKQRTIDPRIWQHKAFLRSPWHCRDVFFYLFSAACDDEGRFDWDPLAILEGAFPRAYPVTEDDVIADLQHLVNEGLALRYGDADACGFLCGWFEHQYIQADRRTPSSLPEPPVRVPSWAVADGVRDACAKHLGRGLKQVTYHDAIDWLTGRERSVNGALTKRSPEVEVEVEVEREVTDSAPPAGAADAEDVFALAPPPEPEPKGTRAKTDRDHAYEACLAACGVEPASLDKSAWAKYAKAMNAVVKAHSLEEVTAWAEHAAADGGRVLGTGAAPEIKVPALVRRELTADTWAGTFAAARTKAKHNGQRFIEHSVNGRIYERDWTDDMHGTVALYTSQGLWDDERGMTTIDPRHPSRQQPVAGA